MKYFVIVDPGQAIKLTGVMQRSDSMSLTRARNYAPGIKRLNREAAMKVLDEGHAVFTLNGNSMLEMITPARSIEQRPASFTSEVCIGRVLGGRSHAQGNARIYRQQLVSLGLGAAPDLDPTET